jgi:hypothetical protein
MKVGQRLFLAVLPAVLGVLAMAGLAYWGQRGRQVPVWVLLAGILTAAASLVLAWHNTRYVARRIEALSHRRDVSADADEPADELDTIEKRIAESERRGATREQAAEALVREYSGLLADASFTVGRKLDDVRLPLHILLSSPFGELNENQEEMIGAAQTAAEDADEALRFIGRIVDLDAGRVESRPESVRPRDLLAPVLAAVGPRLRQAGATLQADLPPMLPHVQVDPQHTREAVSLILDQLAKRAAAGLVVRLTADAMEGFVRLRIEDGLLDPDEGFPLAQRLLRLQGATIHASVQGVLEIHLPVNAG